MRVRAKKLTVGQSESRIQFDWILLMQQSDRHVVYHTAVHHTTSLRTLSAGDSRNLWKSCCMVWCPLVSPSSFRVPRSLRNSSTSHAISIVCCVLSCEGVRVRIWEVWGCGG